MTEGVTTAQPIKVQFQRTQNPFTLTLHPVSHREAIDDFHVDNFIIDPPQRDVEMATSGNVQMNLYNLHLTFSACVWQTYIICSKHNMLNFASPLKSLVTLRLKNSHYMHIYGHVHYAKN